MDKTLLGTKWVGAGGSGQSWVQAVKEGVVWWEWGSVDQKWSIVIVIHRSGRMDGNREGGVRQSRGCVSEKMKS